MQKKNIVISIIVIMFGYLALFGCDREERTVKIGFSGCLSGNLADLGIAGRNSVIMAVDEINRQGGIDGWLVELIIKDDRHDPATALSVDNQLIKDDVIAIIGHMTSTMSKSVKPLIDDNKIIMVSPTSTTNELTGIYDYFFRVTTPDMIQSSLMASYGFTRLSMKKIAVIYDLSNPSFTKGWLDNFTFEYEKLGGNLIQAVSFYIKKEFSYKKTVNKALAADPDGILIIAGAVDTGMFCQQIRKSGSKIKILSSGWAASTQLIHHGGSSVEGIVIPQIFDKASRNAKYLEFKKKYIERFEKEPDFASVCSYEAAQFIFSGLKQAKTRQELKSRLSDVKRFAGLQGHIEIDRFGDARRNQYLISVKNGKFVTIESIELKIVEP